jgi:hypothetical protein
MQNIEGVLDEILNTLTPYQVRGRLFTSPVKGEVSI